MQQHESVQSPFCVTNTNFLNMPLNLSSTDREQKNKNKNKKWVSKNATEFAQSFAKIFTPKNCFKTGFVIKTQNVFDGTQTNYKSLLSRPQIDF